LSYALGLQRTSSLLLGKRRGHLKSISAERILDPFVMIESLLHSHLKVLVIGAQRVMELLGYLDDLKDVGSLQLPVPLHPLLLLQNVSHVVAAGLFVEPLYLRVKVSGLLQLAHFSLAGQIEGVGPSRKPDSALSRHPSPGQCPGLPLGSRAYQPDVPEVVGTFWLARTGRLPGRSLTGYRRWALTPPFHPSPVPKETLGHRLVYSLLHLT
jgi:hypothetical protein